MPCACWANSFFIVSLYKLHALTVTLISASVAAGMERKASSVFVEGLKLMTTVCTTLCSMLQMIMVRGRLFQLLQQGSGSAPEEQSLHCTLTAMILSSFKCEEQSGCFCGAQINYTEYIPTEIGIF